MALKFKTGNVKDVVWKDTNNNNKVVTLIQLNGIYVYARPGTYTTGVLPSGVASLVAHRWTTKEPTAATGTVASGSKVYHADELTFTATADPLWTIDHCAAATINLLNTTTVSGVELSEVSAYPATRQIDVGSSENVSALTVNYYTGTASATTTFPPSTGTFMYVSAPYTVTWAADFDTNWTGTSSGSVEPGASTGTINVTSSRWTYNITAAPGSNAKIGVEYWNASGDSVTVAASSSQTDYAAWKGHTFTYTKSAINSYWTINDAGTNSFTVTGNATVSCANATRVPRTVSFRKSDGVSAATLTYKSTTNGESASVTANSDPTDVWSGYKLEWTATRAIYWDCVTAGTVDAGTAATIITCAGTPLTQTVNAGVSDNISSIVVSYIDGSLQPQSLTIYGGAPITNVWTGGTISYVANAAPYYTASSGSYEPSESDRTVTPAAATPVPRTITLTKGDGVSAATMTYVDTGMTERTKTANITVTNVWAGSTVSWKASAATYWTMVASSGTVAADSAATTVTVVPGASRVPADVAIMVRNNINNIIVEYIDAQGTTHTNTYAVNTTISAWTGCTIAYTPAAATNWTASPGSLSPSLLQRIVDPNVEPITHPITVAPGSNTTISFTYYNSVPTITQGSTTSRATYSAWQGHSFTYNKSANTYWTLSDAGTGSFTVTQASVVSCANATPLMGDVIKTAPVACNITYYIDASSTSYQKSWTAAQTGSVSAWVGKEVSYSYSVATANYWTTINGTEPKVTSGTRTITPPIPKTRNITVKPNANTTITINYTNGSLVETATSSYGSNATFTISNVAAPYAIQAVTSTTNAYWTATVSPTIINPGITAGTFTVTYGRRSRAITLIKNSNVNSISMTYWDLGNVSHTVTVAGTYDTWCGKDVTWAAAAATGYSMSQTSGTITKADSSDPKTISPTATPITYNLTPQTWPYGTTAYYATQANAQNKTSPISTAKIGNTVYVRQDWTSGYHDSNLSQTVNIVQTTLGDTSWTLNDTSKIASLQETMPVTYFRITIKTNNRGALYRASSTALNPQYTQVLASSLGVTYTYTTAVAAGGDGTARFYAPWIGPGNTDCAAASYATANNTYTSSSSVLTINPTSDATYDFKSTLKTRPLHINEGLDSRTYNISYTNSSGKAITYMPGPGEGVNSNGTDVINMWIGATVSLAAEVTTNWSAPHSATFGPTTSTAAITYTRSSQYSYQLGSATSTLRVNRNSTVYFTYTISAAAYRATVGSTQSSITTSTTTLTSSGLTVTATLSSTKITLQAYNPTNKTVTVSSQIEAFSGALAPLAVYFMTSGGTGVTIYNPNNVEVRVVGEYYARTEGGHEAENDDVDITLGARASHTFFAYQEEEPLSYYIYLQPVYANITGPVTEVDW